MAWLHRNYEQVIGQGVCANETCVEVQLGENSRLMVIYVVTQGCYSDYRIVSVWSDKAEAERAVATIGPESDDKYDGARVEEYELNTGVYIPQFVGAMNANGDVERMEIDEDCWFGKTQLVFSGTKKTTQLQFAIRAKTPKHAVKRVNEIRAQLIATDKWEEIEGRLKEKAVQNEIDGRGSYRVSEEI